MINLYIYPENYKKNAKGLWPLIKLVTTEGKCKETYQIVSSVQECDYLLLPEALGTNYQKNDPITLQQILDFAEKQNKQIIAFSGGDFGKTITHKNICTIRLGGFKSKFTSTTFVPPANIQDPLLILEKDFFTLPKFSKPSIGFVGHSDGSFLKFIKELLLFVKKNARVFFGLEFHDYQHFYPSSYYRFKYLGYLLKSNLVICNFIFRNKYRAGANTEESRKRTSIEFYDNIATNLYTFCLRGSGNFSVRFYETLALGRIPILIDTDCEMPLNDSINWENHCIIIPEKQVRHLVDYVVNFHNSHSELELEQMQKNNRDLWQSCLTRENFYNTLVKSLKK